MTVIIRKQKVKHMGYGDKAKVETHIKSNDWAQYVIDGLDKGVSPEKISKTLGQITERALSSVDDISSRFTAMSTQAPELIELQKIEVARAVFNCRSSNAENFYSKVSMAIDGVSPTGNRTSFGKSMLQAQNAEKGQKKPLDKFTITTKLKM